MKFFRIKNYEKYQAKKKDRNSLPWIKLHKKLVNDWAYGQLHDSHKTHFVHMLLSADSVDNQFPYDTRSLRRQLHVGSPIKIEVFEKAGLIEEIGQQNSPRREDILKEEKIYSEENRKPHARSNPKEPDRNPVSQPDVSDCIAHYESEFLRKFKKIPFIKRLNATTALTPVVEKLGIAETNNLITKYLEISDDKFIAGKGYPIYLFPDAVNRLQTGNGSIVWDKNKYDPPKKVAPPPGVDQGQSEKWTECMGKIEGQILPANFESLFEPMAFGGINDGKAILICGDKNHSDCLSENFADLIETTITEIFNEPIKPEFVIEAMV